MIYSITRAELRSLFVSPLSWLLIVVFLVQVSMAFFSRLEHNLIRQMFGQQDLSSYADSVFGRIGTGVFDAAAQNLFLYVPLVTMGLLAREYHSGTIKLAQSSPVRVSDVVLGKYLAAIGFFTGFLAILLGLCLIGWMIVPNLDLPHLLTASLGFFLLASAYAAIGLFMSSLTSHQVVAALSTFSILGLLNFIGSWGQSVPLIADVAFWLSMVGRVDYLTSGLIASKDVIYFLLIILLFLGLTFGKLIIGRVENTSGKIYGTLAVFTAAIAAIGVISSSPRLAFFYDATEVKRMSLSPGSLEALDEFSGPWSITVYGNILDRSSLIRLSPRNRRFLNRALFDNYSRLNPRLNVDYKFFYAESVDRSLFERAPEKSLMELARDTATQHRFDFESLLSQEEIEKIIGRADGAYSAYFVVEWNGQKRLLNAYNDAVFFPAEAELSAALASMIKDRRVIAYVQSAGERSAFTGGGTSHRQIMSQRNQRVALINHGFDVLEIGLDEPIPDVVDILVVAGPRRDYSTNELAHIETYFRNGGNALLLTEPEGTGGSDLLLERFGISISMDPPIEQKPGFSDEYVFSTLTQESGLLGFNPEPSNAGGSVVLTEAVSLLKSSDTAIRNNRYTPVLGTSNSDTVAYGIESPGNGDRQRILIIGDTDFMSTATLNSEEFDDLGATNFAFIREAFRWLSDDLYPVDVQRPLPIDNRAKIDLNDTLFLKILLFGVLPIALLSWSALVFFRRRSR